MSNLTLCKRNYGRCDKEVGHMGKCNNNNKLLFWKSSSVKLKKDLKDLNKSKESIELENNAAELRLEKLKDEALIVERNVQLMRKSLEEAETEFTEATHLHRKDIVNMAIDRDAKKREYEAVNDASQSEERKTKEIKEQFEKFKILIGRKGYASKRRENNETTLSMINSGNTTRYRRSAETKDVLSYIHGGEEGAIFGAWDFLSRQCSESQLQTLMSNFKRGKFLQRIYDKVATSSDTEEAMNKAIATKYLGHLSRRRYQLICKIQQATFNGKADGSDLLPRNEELKLDLRSKKLTHYSIEKFVKGLDIGEIHHIPGYSGVLRTVTALITMIADVNLKIPSNKERLIWFNDIEHHFIVEFSDDGAPESKEQTMTIGSLTLWNFENRVRSRDYHYPLHLLTAQEKDDVCQRLWCQHCDEMELIESNVFTINGTQVTFEFQPSADQSWQCWATNIVSASATHPSPYANVHKSQLSFIGGTIGTAATDTWVPSNTKDRQAEIAKLEEFEKSLPTNLESKRRHERILAFLADNGYRQLGQPRIGIFADRIRPEPLHLEINCWHHVLTMIYLEAVRRSKFDSFMKVLQSPVSSSEVPGCGLQFVGKLIKEQFDIENKRMNVLEVRLIGSQAISLAQYCHRLIDSINVDQSSGAEEIKFYALSIICQTLRDIGGLMNKIKVGSTYTKDLTQLCTTFFNLFALFFPERCQITVWTMGYAVPFHAQSLYKNFKVGFGILSMQGKESLHSSIKQQLRNESNRWKDETTGKWYQLMRSSYIRNFYLPYHFPINSTYHSHYRSRKSANDDSSTLLCQCSRQIEEGFDSVCSSCHNGHEVLQSAISGSLSENLINILKPVQCQVCKKRFADQVVYERHNKESHNAGHTVTNKTINPSKMSVLELKSTLKSLNRSTTGNKDTLRRRLEGIL